MLWQTSNFSKKLVCSKLNRVPRKNGYIDGVVHGQNLQLLKVLHLHFEQPIELKHLFFVA